MFRLACLYISGIGVLVETEPNKESGDIVAGFEGDVNTTFFCRVANDKGNDIVTDWRIQMEGI